MSDVPTSCVVKMNLDGTGARCLTGMSHVNTLPVFSPDGTKILYMSDRLSPGGECFGYRRNDRLFAYYGLQVGRFHGDEVYGSDGRYLGELKSRKRLITNVGKKGRVKSSFAPVLGGSYARFANYVGNVMYVGYEDFPAPDEFR